MEEEKRIDYPILDLRSESSEEIVRILDTDLENHKLLHGTNAKEPFDRLEARQARDVFKESGNKKAVYASKRLFESIFKAVVNREYISANTASYTIGWAFDDGEFIFKVSPDVHGLFLTHYEDCFSDGFIYVLPEEKFNKAHDTKHEYHSLEDQIPEKAYKVPGVKLARTLFPLSSICEYDEREMQQIYEKTHREPVNP